MGFHMLHGKKQAPVPHRMAWDYRKPRPSSCLLGQRSPRYFFKKNLYILSHIFKLKIFSKVETLAKNVIFIIILIFKE